MKKIATALTALVLVGTLAPCLLRADAEPAQAAAVPEVSAGEVHDSLQELSDKLSEARAVPRFENGKPTGYVTYDNENAPSLKNGDVIRSVNGQAPTDPKQAFELISTGMQTNLQVDSPEAPTTSSN